jgi:phosphatidate cytidylyltransferase
MIKRNLGVKDFGSFLPGHGGILDRCDGFLISLPAAYFGSIALHIPPFG